MLYNGACVSRGPGIYINKSSYRGPAAEMTTQEFIHTAAAPGTAVYEFTTLRPERYRMYRSSGRFLAEEQIFSATVSPSPIAVCSPALLAGGLDGFIALLCADEGLLGDGVSV